MFTGFQIVTYTTKRGAVKEVHYLAPRSILKFVYNKRFDSWTMYDSTGYPVGHVHGTWVAKVLRKCAERLQPRIEEIYGPWKESYGASA